MLCRTVLMCVFLPGFGLAEPAVSDNPKFTVDGTVLIFDTDKAASEDNQEIQNSDVEVMHDLLRGNPSVTTVQLNSGGGSVWAGEELARLFTDFELDTVVTRECSSSCTLAFLGGVNRRLERGAKLGFHQRNWSAGSAKAYYDNWHKDEGWETPFDFASWIYKDTQNEVFEEMLFMISRGVDAEFALETKRFRASMWFPTRAELTAAGVLTD